MARLNRRRFLRTSAGLFVPAWFGITRAQDVIQSGPVMRTMGGDLVLSGLVGWWKMNENTGTTIADSTANSNTGTLSGSTIPTWVSGRFSYGLGFNGTTGYVSLASSLSFAGAFSISVWVLPTDFTETLMTVIGEAPTGGANGLRLDTGYPCLRIFNSSGTAATIVCSTVSWNHIVATRDASNNIKYWVNNVDATPTPFQMVGTFLPALFGVTDNSGTLIRYFKGSMDDVRIYNRAITSSEVAALYAEE